METKHGRILLVEDNSDDVMLVHAALKRVKMDHTLMIVADGQQAMAYLQGDGLYADRGKFPFPSLMLLDLLLPKIDGFQVLQWIRAHPQLRRLPVTVFTGSQHPGHLARAYEMGANSFVLKPFSFADFCETVNHIADFWLGRCRLPHPPSTVSSPHENLRSLRKSFLRF
jgi:CheY-like chemotaxis protein